GHLASFLSRTLEHADVEFTDPTGLADDPEAPLRRDTMAVGLVAAYEQATGTKLPTPVGRPFADLHDHPDADTIAKAVGLGLVRGSTDGRYDPAGTVTRGQMASFLTRLLDGLVDDGLAVPPPAPDWGRDVELAHTLSDAVAQTAAPELLDPPL